MTVREDIWIRLRGAAAFVRDTMSASAAQQRLALETARTSNAMRTANHHGFAYNQTLFTMRRYVYAATLGLTALGAAAAASGLKFNVNMEKAQVSFGFLLKSQEGARKEIEFLYELAAKTPFQFQPLMDTARRFIAFGFSVEDTNKSLLGISDAISAMGGSQELIDRVTTAFGQMLVKGKVTGEELRQLSNAMIPAPRYIQEAFHLTERGFARVADAGIPAKAGIEAILAGIQKDFGGASDVLAKTVSGQLSTLKDYVNLLLGTIMAAPFTMLQSRMGMLITDVQLLSEATRDRGFAGFSETLDEVTGSGGNLAFMLRRLRDGTEGWVQFIHSSVIPVLKPFAQILFVSAVALIYLSGEFLRFIDFIPGGVFLLQALVAWLLINKVALMAVTFWTKRKTGADIQMTFWQKRLIVLSAIQTFWMSTLGTAIGVAAINTWAFVTAEYAAILPILAVIAAVALLAAGIIYLYERFESLRPIILILSPIIIGFWLLAKFIDKATDSMERFKDTFDTHIDIFDRHGLGFLNQGAGDLLGFGGGDRSTSPQLATVNSRASRDITDVNLPALLQQLQGQKMIIEPSAVNIDGREVGEIVWDHRLDRQARR